MILRVENSAIEQQTLANMLVSWLVNAAPYGKRLAGIFLGFFEFVLVEQNPGQEVEHMGRVRVLPSMRLDNGLVPFALESFGLFELAKVVQRHGVVVNRGHALPMSLAFEAFADLQTLFHERLGLGVSSRLVKDKA